MPRKVVVRLEVVMEYESYRAVPTTDEEREHARWALEENHCISNVVERLAELVKTDDEHHVCNICRFARVTVLPDDTPAYRGYESDD